MSAAPGLFAMPPGADFPAYLVAGLRRRLAGQPPEAMAQVDLIVNTARMRRRIVDLFVAGGAGILPRISLLTDLGAKTPIVGLSAAVPSLRRRLELSVLIARLLDQQPDLAPRSSLFDLSDSLASLMDEMRGEGVDPSAIARIDVSEHSAHWKRTKDFMAIIAPFFGDDSPPDTEARQRRVVLGLLDQWAKTPPQNPVIVAGSTGSRGTTALLMQAVARLPQGMVVLPGYDFDQPTAVWDALDNEMVAEDHPQFRFHRLMQTMGMTHRDVQLWDGAVAPAPDRNRLISLSLRPAPVTDQWLTEGPNLPDLPTATKDMTLIEAPSPRAEALAIALILRAVADAGQTAALVTPDRGLTRQVTAALDRWNIVPDDSAGRPLALSAPGRFLRHVAGLFGRKTSSESLLVLLKHPLTHSGADRGNHLRLTRELELWLRKRGAPFPDRSILNFWSGTVPGDAATLWVEWLTKVMTGVHDPGALPLTGHVARHIQLAETLAAGMGATGSGDLWQGKAGEEARKAMDSLLAEASGGGVLSPSDYQGLFDSIISNGEVREEIAAHPRIMIWGTLEARVQGADLIILGGLNDGIWPQLPPPDPWMNRRMRRDAGLLLPDRRIGLSAHDYQQAVAAQRVVLTRATRNAESETVPSRWINRLTNLMSGVAERNGPMALSDMRARGAYWLEQADILGKALEITPAAARPAPCPPLAARPRKLPVTAIKTLIRDPYGIYARYILRLRKLDPLHPLADARLRGQVLHKVLERFVKERVPETREQAKARLAALTQATLEDAVPWAAARVFWQARLDRSADFFLDQDGADGGISVNLEQAGTIQLFPLEFELHGRPDRIDRLPDGRLHIVDYKTGAPPSASEQKHFDKQLLLLAAMAENGAFADLGPQPVANVSYLGLGPSPKVVSTEITPDLVAEVWGGLRKLIGSYMSDDKGYTPRRALQKEGDVSDYDHLSRFGEWDMTDIPEKQDVGR
jgi:ATP-dependent helicase/nuclease subunit B